jgi:hypothetical protein
MPSASYEWGGVRVWLADETGPPLLRERDALELIAEASAADARLVALPAARCGDDFFRLRTRILGEVVQKLVNYGLRTAIVGDVSRWIAESDAFRDFLREANRGRQIWFVTSLAELEQRLSAEAEARC